VPAAIETQECPPRDPAFSCAPGEPDNNWQGRPGRYLKVRVPATLPVGEVWLWVRTRRLESNPVRLEVR